MADPSSGVAMPAFLNSLPMISLIFMICANELPQILLRPLFAVFSLGNMSREIKMYSFPGVSFPLNSAVMKSIPVRQQ